MKYKLSDICNLVSEKVKVSKLTKDRYISTENMLADKNGITIASSLPNTDKVRAFRTNDVLVSNIRPYFKKIWLAKFDGGCSNDILVFRAKDGVSENFLYYTLSNDDFFDYATATAKGTKMPRGDKKAIMDYNVNKYIGGIQEKLVNILVDIDRLIQLNLTINKNLEEQVITLYKAYFIDSILNDRTMPPTWRHGTVSEIVEIHDAKRVPLSNRERATLAKIYPYYGATSIMDYVDKYLFEGIYLLLAEDGTVVDNKGYPVLQYVDGKFWVNNHAHILTGKNGYTTELLYLLFKLTNVKSIVTGAVQPKINQSNLLNLGIIIPSRESLENFNTLIQPFFAEIRKLRAANHKLVALKNSLLPKLISGNLNSFSIND